MTDADDEVATPPSRAPGPDPRRSVPPPPLPADTAGRLVPPGVRDFVGGDAVTVAIAPGRLFWAELPGGVRPDVGFSPGPRRGSVEVTVSLVGFGILAVSVTAEVRDGRLHVDTSSLPETLPGVGDVRPVVGLWLRDLDVWLASTGKQLGDLRLRRGRLRLTKVDRVERAERLDLTTPGSPTATSPATSRRALPRPSRW